MDFDTTRSKDSYEKILSAFANQEADILIGTQMIVKGHDFPNVTLVGVIFADGSLNIDDYRANERTFQILTQVAGRAGRGQDKGNVIIQTYNPNKIINEKLQIILYKPVPAPIDKIKNKIRWRIIIKCKFNNEIIEALNTSLKDLNSKKLKDVKTIIDLNPTNMM